MSSRQSPPLVVSTKVLGSKRMYSEVGPSKDGLSLCAFLEELKIADGGLEQLFADIVEKGRLLLLPERVRNVDAVIVVLRKIKKCDADLREAIYQYQFSLDTRVDCSKDKERAAVLDRARGTNQQKRTALAKELNSLLVDAHEPAQDTRATRCLP
jgi:hypothetical protein